MKKVFYLIYNKNNNTKCPSYLMLVNDGHLLQGSIYDASKFTKKDLAEKELKTTKKIFKDKKFEIISLDTRIFGENPRWVKES